MTDQGKKKEPIHKIQRGSIEAAVWENTSGKKTWYSVQIYRRYKTEQGEYREANSYALADLVQVSRIAELAEEWLNRRAESSAAAPPPTKGGSNEKRRRGDFLLHPAQAIADGVLIDATELAKEAGFRLPVALTSGVWAECVAVPAGVAGQDETGRLWDVLTLLHFAIARQKSDGQRVDFAVHVRNDNRAGDPPLVQPLCPLRAG